jgi:hypothetical protein
MTLKCSAYPSLENHLQQRIMVQPYNVAHRTRHSNLRFQPRRMDSQSQGKTAKKDLPAIDFMYARHDAL